MLHKNTLCQAAVTESKEMDYPQAQAFLDAVQELEVDDAGALTNYQGVHDAYRAVLVQTLTDKEAQGIRALGFLGDLGRLNGEPVVGAIGTVEDALLSVGADRLRPFVDRILQYANDR